MILEVLNNHKFKDFEQTRLPEIRQEAHHNIIVLLQNLNAGILYV